MNSAKFHGVYEHFYKNNVFNNDFTTHYVVLAYEVTLTDEITFLNDQHGEYRWFEVNELLAKANVHKYTKNYFKESV